MDLTAKVGTDERVLVVGQPFHEFVRMVSDGFRACGVSVKTSEYEVPRQDPIQQLQYALSKDRVLRRNEAMKRANALALERSVMSHKPDYVVVMNGGEVTNAARSFCTKHGIRMAMWAHDPCSRFKWIADAAHSYDTIYTHELNDLEILSQSGTPHFLPMAYDPTRYFPIDEEVVEDVDVSFVGAIRRTYGRRSELLRGLSKELKGSRLEIWSDPTPFYSPFRYQDFLIMIAGGNSTVRRSRFTHEQNSKLYNRTKLCLNIHQELEHKAVNPRSFEILGSGGFLLTDMPLKAIEDFEDGRDYVAYTGFDDLLQKSREYLRDEEARRRIEESGHRKALKSHTYAARSAEILKGLRRGH
jgi:spore maturation protein CgeB